MTEAQRHVSALVLDRRSLGALSEQEARETDDHLGECVVCRGRLAAQRESFESFERYVLPALLPRLESRSQRFSISRLAAWFVVPVLALAALVVVVLPHGAVRDEVAVKGGANLQIFARRGSQVFAATDGARLQPGDALRFAIQPGGLPYLLIVSRDGAGQVSVYYPFGGTESARLDPDKRSELPGSVELDATLGEERIFAVLSRQPLEAAKVSARLAGPATDPSAAELGAESLLRLSFVKGAP